MYARSRRLFVETLLFTSTLFVAALSQPATDVRLLLPFAVYPGAIYLALLSWPALLSGGGAEDGTDLQLAAYSGPAYTMAGGLKLTQSGGTDLSFGAIPWKGQPFKPPIYYGLRGLLWPANGPQGIMADFTHIKAKAVMQSVVDQSGTREGAPVSAQEKLSATFSKLEFTHGYNLFTLNVVRVQAQVSRFLMWRWDGRALRPRRALLSTSSPGLRCRCSAASSGALARISPSSPSTSSAARLSTAPLKAEAASKPISARISFWVDPLGTLRRVRGKQRFSGYSAGSSDFARVGDRG